MQNILVTQKECTAAVLLSENYLLQWLMTVSQFGVDCQINILAQSSCVAPQCPYVYE